MKNKSGIQQYEVDDSINIQTGCENGCRYCFARYDAVHRFHNCTAEGWLCPRINNKKVDSTYSNHGFVAFPTTHDITDKNISQCLCVLRKLLDAGNRVLIISKPRWKCIALICETFKEYRKKILFRFTIGSTNDEVLQFWEPGASSFGERLSCLEYAYHSGYQTSVSCEPMLDGYVQHVYDLTAQYITDTFWIGLLRHFNSRVNMAGVTDDEQDRFIVPLLKIQSPQCIKAIYEMYKDKPLIRWKESVIKMMGQYRRTPKKFYGGRINNAT